VIQDVTNGVDGMCVPLVEIRIHFQIHGSSHVKVIVTHGEVFDSDLLGLGELLEGLSDQFVIHEETRLPVF